MRIASARSLASLSPDLAARSALETALSRVWMSASISSISIVSMSETGSTLPATWTTSGSSKQRTTCKIASTSRMWLRNLFPSPSPSLAPLTIPAMSTSLSAAGTSFLGTMYLLIRREPVVGDADDPLVRLDRAERIVRALGRLRAGQGVEQRALAHVGQADDSGFHGINGTFEARGWDRGGSGQAGPFDFDSAAGMFNGSTAVTWSSEQILNSAGYSVVRRVDADQDARLGSGRPSRDGGLRRPTPLDITSRNGWKGCCFSRSRKVWTVMVSILLRGGPAGQLGSLVDPDLVVRQGLEAFGGDQVIPLDPDAADAFDVEAGLEGDDVARDQDSSLPGTK